MNDHPIKLGKRSINCLQYADDLVILSETPQGLQSCLNKLNKYCDRWHLQLNTAKTKIMIFNPTGKKISNIFNFGKEMLEVVNSYSYLGILFTASGSFTAAQK